MATQQSVSLPPQLQDAISRLDENTAHANQLRRVLSPDQLTRRVNPAAWSITENIAHLALTSEAYFPLFDEAFAKARRQNLTGGGPFSMEFMPRLLKWYLEPPYRTRMKTPPPFVPANAGPADEIFLRFSSTQTRLRSYFEEAGKWRLDQLKVVSPFAKQVKYNVFSAIQMILAHQRRHLWACDRLRPA